MIDARTMTVPPMRKDSPRPIAASLHAARALLREPSFRLRVGLLVLAVSIGAYLLSQRAHEGDDGFALDLPPAPDEAVPVTIAAETAGGDAPAGDMAPASSRSPSPTPPPVAPMLEAAPTLDASVASPIGPALPFEGRLIGSALPTEEETDKALVEAAFGVPETFEALEAQVRMDADASALSRLYRTWVEQAMVAAGVRAPLVGFVCGVRICVGEFGRGHEREFADWTIAFTRYLDGRGSGLQTGLWHSSDGVPRMRFAFSIRKAR